MDADSYRRAINEAKANKIAEAISTPEGRMIMYAAMWFPMEMPLPGETRIEWAQRKAEQLGQEREEFLDEQI